MNKYIHHDGMEISMQDSFNLLQKTHFLLINAVGRMFCEKPGVKESGFEVSYTSSVNARHPGEDVEISLIFSVGDAMFPNGEIFTGQNYDVRIPVEKTPGYRYVVIQHQVLRETLGSFAPGFPVKDRYLDCQDILSVHLRAGTASTNLLGNEMIIARFIYTEDMAYPTIENLQPFYFNYISVSEMIDTCERPRIDGITQDYQHIYAPPSYNSVEMNNVDFLPGRDTFLHVKAEIPTNPSGPRCFWLARSQSQSGRLLWGSSLLPHVPPNVVPLKLIKGLSYNTKVQKLDCYRDARGYFSSEQDIQAGGSASGSINLSAIWHSHLPVLKLVNTVDAPANCFVQSRTVNSDQTYMQETPTRLTNLSGKVPANLMIFPDQATSIKITSDYVSPSNHVVDSASANPARNTGVNEYPACLIITHQMGPDAMREGPNDWSSDCRLIGETTVFTYHNDTSDKQYLISAALYNFVAPEAGSAPGSTAGGLLAIPGHPLFRLSIEEPLAPPTPPHVSTFTAKGLGIEIAPYEELAFNVTVLTAQEFCRFHGNIQIVIGKKS